MFLAAEPAMADVIDIASSNPFQTTASNSLYVTLALFVLCVPGIWSQVKRAPVASKKRKVYEVDGPKKDGGKPSKEWAGKIMAYFKKYNYEVKEMGEVITFIGLYQASKGAAAAVTFYTFVGMMSVALVMSLLVPQVGNWWYLLTLFAPAAYVYYFQKGERVEEVRVKMASADDDMTTEITIEGDIEEIGRFNKELGLVEKGMVRVKGLLEG